MTKDRNSVFHIFPRAVEVQDVIRPLAMNFKNSVGAVNDAARWLQISQRQVYRLIGDYRLSPYLDTLTPKVATTCKSRLAPKVEEIIQGCIQKYYLGTDERVSIAQLSSLIFAECTKIGETPPCYKTVVRRVKALPKSARVRARKTKDDPRSCDPHPNHHLIKLPLQQVQIDHTEMDVMCDLRPYGLRPMRPWLTLAIDVATRLVYGYYISIRPPTTRSLMFALMQGAMPKRQWLESRGISWQAFCDLNLFNVWPLQGLPAQLHFDNDRTFKNDVISAACCYLGIEVKYRPIKTPYYGAHIERLIGTFMKRLHAVPGTTFSNSHEKRDYDAEGRAILSLEDVERWFLLEVLAYHTREHRSLGCTPLQKFEGLQGQMPRSALAPPDPFRLQQALLPRVGRSVTNQGVRVNRRDYWHDSLHELIGSHVVAIYRPWDMRTVALSLDGMSSHIELRLMPDGSDIIHGEIWQEVNSRADVCLETSRQAQISAAICKQQFDLIDALKRRKSDRKSWNYKPLANDVAATGELPDSAALTPFTAHRRSYE